MVEWACKQERAHAQVKSAAELLADAGLDRLPKGAPRELVEQAFRALAATFDGADPLRCVAVREAAIARLTEAGVGSPAKWVDAALPRSHTETGAHTQGQTLLLSDPEPWPEPVDGAQLLLELAATVRRFVMDSGALNRTAVPSNR